jgi:hypothetical protein
MKNIFALFILAILTFSSCTEKAKSTELNSCKDNAVAEMVYLDVYKQAQTYLGVFLEKKSPSDPNIIFTSNVNQNSITFPFTLTIYYGSSDHLCSDNKYRRGALTLSVSASNGDSTIYSVNNVDVTFSNYYLNQSNLLGTFTINNGGLKSGNNHHLFNLGVSNGFVINGNGTMSWNSDKVLEQTLGSSTPNDLSDDEYLLTGTASGKDFKGTDFTENIATDCTVDPNCKYFIKAGKISVLPYNLDLRNCDYGTAPGSCTGQVKVQIKESSSNFSL